MTGGERTCAAKPGKAVEPGQWFHFAAALGDGARICLHGELVG